MTKTMYHTIDIFDNVNPVTRMRYFDFCHKRALDIGLICKCSLKDRSSKLEMWGTKCQFLRYYLETLLKCDYKMKGFKRWFSFLFS